MSCKVLIVDDEPDVAAYMAAVLKASGHVPSIAHSVDEGLAQLEESRPDVICLDIMMPKESGVSMYIQLKQNDDTKDIPVVVISGVELEGQFDFSSYMPDESLPQPECYMEKPIKVKEFVETIERLSRES